MKVDFSWTDEEEIADELVERENVTDVKNAKQKILTEYFHEMIENVKEKNDYAKLENYLVTSGLKIWELSDRTTILEVELNEIKEEIFGNELSSEDFKEILSFEYKE